LSSSPVSSLQAIIAQCKVRNLFGGKTSELDKVHEGLLSSYHSS
jgi:hypothetical protein